MDRVEDVNRYDYDYLNPLMHHGMVSDIDVASMVMGRVREGHVVLNLGIRQEVLTSYVIRVWNGVAISVNASGNTIELLKRKIRETGSQRRALLLQASVRNIPLREECVDVVISMFTTRRKLLEEAGHLFQEWKRVLIKTGRFVLVDWIFEPKSKVQRIFLELREISAEKQGVEEHSYSCKEYRQILKQTGFDIEEIRFFPRKISLDRFNGLGDKKAVELLRELGKMDSEQLQIKLAIISSRVKR